MKSITIKWEDEWKCKQVENEDRGFGHSVWNESTPSSRHQVKLPYLGHWGCMISSEEEVDLLLLY
jgi:hypothetical protein